MIVHKLTTEQANTLRGKEYVKDVRFNPIQDADGNWFISVEEVEQCNTEEFSWVKDLPTIPYNPLIVEMPHDR